MDSQYSNITMEINTLISKEDKKKHGIFITPKNIICSLLQEIKTYILEQKLNIHDILEPSCGTCEIVSMLNAQLNNVTIDAVELNTLIFNKIQDINFKQVNSTNTIHLINQDFLKHDNLKKYDLIIANPPYVVCKKEDVPKNYKPLCIGRPNLFCIFIIHSLLFLKENGVSAFIIPKSFLNCHYYSLVRNYIKSCCVIVKIINFDNDFIDTDQPTMGIILHKKQNEEYCNYSISLNNNYIFTTNKQEMIELFQGSTTLEQMGLSVKTGQIVWNENKDILTADTSKTLLIYNSNITKGNAFNVVDFKKEKKGVTIKQEKFQFINCAGSNDPVICVNRGNGNSAYKLNYALINTNMPFVCENHLNVIYSTKIKDKTQLLQLYDTIIKSFQNPKTLIFINLFCGNNALSKTELQTIFPIYI
jgi:type I restriction-modification system DNA methylase subunit